MKLMQDANTHTHIHNKIGFIKNEVGFSTTNQRLIPNKLEMLQKMHKGQMGVNVKQKVNANVAFIELG